jgi:hypothetical protein
MSAPQVQVSRQRWPGHADIADDGLYDGHRASRATTMLSSLRIAAGRSMPEICRTSPVTRSVM